MKDIMLLQKQQQQQEKEENEKETLERQVSNLREESNRAAEDASQAESELESIEKELDDLIAGIPNLLDDIVPDGDDDTQNEIVDVVGDIHALPKQLSWYINDDASFKKFKFTPLWHDDVATNLNGWKQSNAVSMSGSRFVALSGPIAMLERALSTFFLDLHTTQHNYTEVSVPYVVGRSALEGTSQLPKFEEDLFRISPQSHTCNGEDAFLIPTAEVPLTNMHAGDILDESDLPISYVAHTPCFRAEAGSYGRDTRGLIRTHQFHKVELVKITSIETSNEQHELLTSHAEQCLKLLQLPYRKVRLCSGDVGFSARHCYDLEVWLPGSQEYREISSCSNTGDFQSRRMALRYRPTPAASSSSSSSEEDKVEHSDNGKKKNKKKAKKAKKPRPLLCHTINGSGLAVGRALCAILENYQLPNGNVQVPEVLRKYMGGKDVLEKVVVQKDV